MKNFERWFKWERHEVEPPLYEKTATFRDFTKAVGLPIRIAPDNLKEYISYKYWAYANKMNAYGGACHDEEKAFRRSRELFLKEDWDYFINEVLDNSPD